MKDEKTQFELPLEERDVKIKITRLANGWYQFPKGYGPETPIPPQVFEDFERSGGVHWKTHEIDERPYRKFKFNQHLNERLAQIVVAKHNNTELKD
jgi:hypothetical protein